MKVMKSKPIIVRERGVSVKIYQAKRHKKTKGGKSRRYKEFTIAYYVGNERRRETFSDIAKAKLRAREIAVSILRGRFPVLELTNADSESYVQALNLLKPLDIPLHSAVEEYVVARSHLDGESLLSAAKEYAARRKHAVDKPVREVVDDLLATKQRDGLSKRYIDTLRGHLNRFADAFKTNIGSVTARVIEEWLAAQKLGPRGRNNIRTSIVTLFHFARDARGYLPKDQRTEADYLPRAKDRGGKIGILNPKQLADVIQKAPADMRLYFALGAFTGMRSSEILKLDWHDINFERGHITVAAARRRGIRYETRHCFSFRLRRLPGWTHQG